MAVKKSELYSTLWKCCDELRGGMDASQYKDYVLVILFVKYISDKSRSDEGFDIDIPGGCYFEDFVALKYNPQIQISAESETKRSIFREKDKTKRSKKESAQHSKSRNKSFVMTSVSAL